MTGRYLCISFALGILLLVGCASDPTASAEFRALQERLAEAEATLQTANTRLATTEKSLEDTAANLKAVTDNLLVVESERNSLLEQVDALATEKERLIVSSETNRTASSQREAELNEFWQNAKELNSSLQQELEKSTQAREEVNNRLTEVQADLEKTQASLKTTEDLLQQKNSELEELRNAPPVSETLAREIEQLEAEVRKLSIERRDHLDRLYVLRDEVPDLQREKDQLEEAVVWLESRLENAESLIQNYSGLIWTSAVACSGSMEPRIGCTDRLVLELAPDPDTIEIGQVILFRPNNYTECSGLPYGGVLHRVVAKWQEYGEDGLLWKFRTKGDNNLEPDQAIPEENVCHRLIAVDEDYYPKMETARAEALESLRFLRLERDAYYGVLDEYLAAGGRIARQCTYDPALSLLLCYDVAQARGDLSILREAYKRLEPFLEDWGEAIDAYKEKLDESRSLFRQYYPDYLIAVPPR